MSLDTALDDRLKPIDAELARLRAELSIAIETGTVNAGDLSRLAARVATLEATATTPADPSEPPDPPVGPVPDPGPTPIPNPPGIPDGSRSFGVNLGEPQAPDKPWRRDQPLLPDGTLDPEYVRVLTPVGGTLRFMDKNEINNKLDPPPWNEWVETLDWQAELCNRCKGNFWLNFHYRSTAKHVADTMRFVRELLNPGLRILVAWANEPWIGSPTDVGRQIIAEAGSQLGSDSFFSVWADNMRRVFDAAKAADPTCITVMETQTANVWVTGKLHNAINGKYDAVGITLYYGTGLGKTPPNTITLDDLFQLAQAKLVDKEIPRVRDHLQFCKDKGKLCVSYESGNHWVLPIHLQAGREQVVQKLIEAQTDPRINGLYDRMLRVWNTEGGSEYRCHFNFIDLWDKHGGWGLGESLDSIEQSPKYRHAAGLTTP